MNDRSTFLNRLGFCLLFSLGSSLFFTSATHAQENPDCPVPVLSRLQRHRVASGETLEAIARQYNLLPQTLTRFNPGLGRRLPVGREIIVPPLNGMRAQAPRGATWKDLQAAYGIRADVLFELNGCTAKPNVVFIPGANWSGGTNPANRDYLGLAGYPLEEFAIVGFAYGWQTEPGTENQRFHSGLDLLADPGAAVLAADTGTVAFVGQQGNYGNLVILSHGNNLQTRYAHLGSVAVRVGESVRAGQPIGTVGSSGQPDLVASHLHFEVRQQSALGWIAKDPEFYLRDFSDTPLNLQLMRGSELPPPRE